MADLKTRFGVGHFKPLVPKVVREYLAGCMREGSTALSAATQAKRAWTEGQWVGEAGDFAHVGLWGLGEWMALARKVKLATPGLTTKRPRRTKAEMGAAAPPKTLDPMAGLKAAFLDSRKLSKEEKALKRAHDAKVAEEAQARAEIVIDGKEPELDAKKDLELLRRALRAKLTIDEQATLMVQLVRGDNAAVAKGTLDQIREVMGWKAVNVPEGPTVGNIFTLPEGAGPAIR